MSAEPTRNIGASVRRRLLNRARERGTDYNLVLLRFLNERALYRLSKSRFRDSFILKGAMTFGLWVEAAHRPTRDVDLLASPPNDSEVLPSIFREILRVAVEPDGVEFDVGSLQEERIMHGDRHAGMRIRVDAVLAGARLKLHIDIGFGDVVIPEPVIASFPTLLDFPAPEVRVYPPEAVIAEKFEAMVTLGMANTRMKDFYDIWLLANALAFERPLLASAVGATFQRRGTPLPTGGPPLALTGEFAENLEKVQQWQAFLGRTGVRPAPPLAAMLDALASFLMPVVRDEATDADYWSP